MKQNNWTEQLRRKLADHEAEPPADLWADIEAALPVAPRRARFVPLRRWAAAAAVALVLGAGGLLWWNGGKKSAPQREAYLAEQMIAADEHDGLVASAQPSAVQRQSAAVGHDLNDAEQTELTDAQPQPTDAQPQPTDTQSQPTDVQQPADKKPAHPQSPALKERHRTLAERPRRQHARSTVAVGLYAANGFSDREHSNAVLMAQTLASNYHSTSVQAASRQAPIFLTGYEEQQHHRQPLSFGLSVALPLTEQLSLTSGLVYTRLSSDFTQTLRSQQYTRQQTLHYVGVPLGLSYRLWQHRHLSVYLSATVQADWNVSAQTETEGVRQHISRDRMQWSASGSLGLQYDLLPGLSLYAEPGVGHYFDNGSTIQNYFKDRPTSLKLQTGLRLTLGKGSTF